LVDPPVCPPVSAVYFGKSARASFVVCFEVW
jgi:hypothetical protein